MQVSDLKGRIEIIIGEHPVAFNAVRRLAKGPDDRLTSRDTRVVIEGFPRSANTFSVWAFNQAQGSELKMAHHLHYPSQILRGVKLGIPTLVLLRNPEDAIKSLLIRNPQSLRNAILHYISFYSSIIPYSYGFVTGSFEEVTRDFGAVTRKLNEKFSTNFIEFDHTEENVARVYGRIDELHKLQNEGRIAENWVARPTGVRRELPTGMQFELERQENVALMRRATLLYNHFSEVTAQ